MNDMRSVIVPKSDQINADDLIGGSRTITIREVAIRAGQEQPVSIHFEGDNGKPFKPCKSMARVMVQCWGADANQYVGRSMTLYRDPGVKWGGMAVGGIRISHMTDIKGAQTMALTETKGSKKLFTVKPLKVEAPADQTSDGLSPADEEYLAKLQGALDKCTAREAVSNVAGKQSVQNALANAPEAVTSRINVMVKAALDRFPDAPSDEPDLDDDDFRGVATPTSEAA